MISFRKATITDSESITSLVNSAYRGEYAKNGWTTEANLLDGQRTDSAKIQEMILAAHSQIILVNEDNVTDKIIGCINVIEEPNALYFGMLTVEPLMQNRGIAKLLLKHVEELAKKLNFNTLRMTVIIGRQELVDFYERLGFVKTGQTEAFPEDPRYGVPKSGKLILEEFVKLI